MNSLNSEHDRENDVFLYIYPCLINKLVSITQYHVSDKINECTVLVNFALPGGVFICLTQECLKSAILKSFFKYSFYKEG